METIVVSPEDKYVGEEDFIEQFFVRGLTRYHLRKPYWSREQCSLFLERIPRRWHGRISIHQHHCLAAAFDVGLHFKDSRSRSDDNPPELFSGPRSRSLHSLESLKTECSGYDYVFLSPVFSSISKPNYRPKWTEQELLVALDFEFKKRLFALGGIDASNTALAASLGFGGVVLHGTVWQSADPLKAFQAIGVEAA